MKKVAVIGDPDFNTGFRLVGIRDVYDVGEEGLAEVVQGILKRDDIGIVVIRHDYLRKLPLALRREIEEKVEPTFVAVGGMGGVEELREKIRKAIGVDLWR
jgi:V/A-type H+-transporting ATPase subunit F